MARPLPALLVLAACQPPPDAPEELGALSGWLFRHFQVPLAARDGLETMADLLGASGVTAETPVEDRVWTLPPLSLEDLVDLPARPDRDPEGVRGLGSAYVSGWPPRCHARVHVAADQLPVEPNATHYVRRFPFDDDPSCFPDRRCEQVHAVSEVTRENLFLALDFELHKIYAWVDVVDTDGVTREAILARSWAERSFEGRGGVLWQSHTTDLWLPHEDGGAWRYQAHWSETELHGLGDTSTIQLQLNRTATEEAMVQTDEVLADLCADGP